MIGEIENDLYHDGNHDHDYDDESSIPEMFRSTSGLLESLEKLTNEIKANILSEEGPGFVTGSNEESWSNDDEDFYWDGEDNYYSDDDDPDSGENKLFSMMDELVVELVAELKDDSIDEDYRDDQSVVDEENDESIMDKGEHTYTAEIANKISKGDNHNIFESEDSVSPTLACISSKDCSRSISNLELSQPIVDRIEKHLKLHQHVKILLQQVTELTNSICAKKRKAIKNEHNDKISANITKKIEQGDYDADRLEHLMGAIATYGQFREANTNTNAIASLSSPSKPCSAVNMKKRRKRTNKHKRRKSKSLVQTQQSLQILFDSLIALDEKLSRENLPKSWQIS